MSKYNLGQNESANCALTIAELCNEIADKNEDLVSNSPDSLRAKNAIKVYDIDSMYIDRLLDTYSANDQGIRDEIENALQKLKKSENVKQVYREILNAIDDKEIDPDEDIFAVKRRYFTEAHDQVIGNFANTWYVAENELHSSAIQYVPGVDRIPNIGSVIDSKQYDLYKVAHPEAKPLKYGPEMKRQWRKTLDEVVLPLDDELR